MALIFEDAPTGYNSEQGFIRWFGVDAGENVECRITATALTRDWGADGTTNTELLRAFEENREMIEKIAISKYTLGDVTPEQTRTVIVIDYAGS